MALPKIVIAAVNGPAVGLGAEFSVAADIRIAADSAWFQRSYQTDLRAILRHEVEALLECMESQDYREGVSAFLDKRTPRFTGE